MKKQLAVLIVLGVFILSSCGSYHSKMRFSKVKKHDKIDLATTSESIEDLEEVRIVDYQQTTEEESVELKSNPEVVQERQGENLGRDSAPIEDSHEIEEAQEDNIIVSEEPLPTEEKIVNPLAVAGFTSAVLPFALFAIHYFTYIPYFWLITLLLLGLAVIFSAIAIEQIRNNPDYYRGRGFAIAGIVIPSVLLILFVILVALILIMW